MIVTRAYCERCETSIAVTPAQLLELDRCRCEACGALLVLVADDDDGPDDERPAPLPAFDGGDTQAVRRLASSGIHQILPPPVDFGDELRQAAASAPPLEDDPLAGVVETVSLKNGTTGGGSRSYDKDDLLDALRTPSAAAPARSAPAPRSASPQAPPRGGAASRVQWGEDDADWAALLDESLPELEEEDTNARRRVIRLSGSEADAKPATAEELAALLRPHGFDASAAGLGASAEEDDDPATRPFSRSELEGDGDDPATRPFSRAELAQPAETDGAGTQRWAANKEAGASANKKDEPTRKWSLDERAAAADPAPAPERPRAVVPANPTRRVSRADLQRDAALQRFRLREPAPEPQRRVGALQFDALDRALVCARAPEGAAAAGYARLYQQLLRGEGARPRAVLVTSPRRGDGRTTVAANLALAAAAAGERHAFLVSADPAGEHLLRAFGLGVADAGLLDVLRDHDDPRRYLIELSEGLDLLPLGPPGSDLERLLTSDDVGHLLTVLTDLAPDGLILIDGPPLLAGPVATALSRQADGVLLVVRGGRTPRRAALSAASMLADAPTLGVVYNAG